MLVDTYLLVGYFIVRLGLFLLNDEQKNITAIIEGKIILRH